jgi:hypothetical protein
MFNYFTSLPTPLRSGRREDYVLLFSIFKIKKRVNPINIDLHAFLILPFYCLFVFFDLFFSVHIKPAFSFSC